MTRRDLLGRAGVGFLGAALATTMGACVPPAGQRATPASTPTATGVPRRGGVLRLSQPADIILAWVPHALTPSNGALYSLVYETLVSYDAQLRPQPKLATSWAWSPDYLQLSLKLRAGVKFHTGRAFTSADAKFNLERLRDPALSSQWLNYARGMQVEAPDPGTLVIKYEAPAKSSFDVLSATFMADPVTLDQTRDGKTFVGTGPFRFKEWRPNDHFSVVRDPDYWQPGKPYLDEVQVRISPDPQSALINLESGGLDWVAGVPGQDARRLQSDPAYQVLLTGTGGSFYYLGLDVNVPVLADKRVRQAFAYALDRQYLVDAGLYGLARPASIPWPRQSLAYDAELDKTYTYDLTRAHELLIAAGWDTNTVVPLLLSNAYPATHPMAEIVQQDLAKIGLQVAIQKLEAADFAPRLQKGQFGGAWITNMGFMNLSPATFFISAFPVRMPNASNFVSPRYQQLIAESYAETDDQQLKMELRELTQILLDEAFVIPIVELSSATQGPDVTRAAVKNVIRDDWGSVSCADVWLDA